MARLNEDITYRVALNSERSFTYVCAKDDQDLIRFLVDQYFGKHDIYGVKRLGNDGMLYTVKIVTSPLFQELSSQKLESLSEEEKISLDEQINKAKSQLSSSPQKGPTCSFPDKVR